MNVEEIQAIITKQKNYFFCEIFPEWAAGSSILLFRHGEERFWPRPGPPSVDGLPSGNYSLCSPFAPRAIFPFTLSFLSSFSREAESWGPGGDNLPRRGAGRSPACLSCL